MIPFRNFHIPKFYFLSFRGKALYASKYLTIQNNRLFKEFQIATTTTTESPQSCPTLCDPTDGSPPGSTIPGILQARTLEWVAIYVIFDFLKCSLMFPDLLFLSFTSDFIFKIYNIHIFLSYFMNNLYFHIDKNKTFVFYLQFYHWFYFFLFFSFQNSLFRTYQEDFKCDSLSKDQL